MPNVVLASGQITSADQLSVELVQAIETPDAVLIRWPGGISPTVTTPRRFPATALAVIACLDQAMIELARIEAAEL